MTSHASTDASARPASTRGRWPRLLVALALFGVGVRAALPEVVDDLYISYAYALSLVERGTMEWSSGARVEGYSNTLWVVLLAVGRAVGAPVTWWAKAWSATAGAVLLFAIHRRAPASWSGNALVVGLGAWGALSAWAGRGMESTAFALALWYGWGGVAGGAGGIWALGLAALLHPEGSVYLALGVALRWGRLGRVGWATVALVGAWHLGRLAWFGSLVPATVVAKLGGENGLVTGVRQGAVELFLAAPLLVLALVTWRPRRWEWVLLPLALQLSLLIAMRGDWMGDTRMLLPGIVAALAALSRGEVRAPGRWQRAALLTLPLLLLNPVRSGGVQPRWTALLGPSAARWSELRLPLREDLAFVIETVPEGAAFETGDIGVPGLIPGLRLLDADGLTDPARGAYLAGLSDPEAVGRRYAGEDPVACVRRREGDSEVRTPQFVAWMQGYAVALRVRAEGHRSVWWCRDGLARPSLATVAQRWSGLADRLPEYPTLAWNEALAWSEAGDLEAATAALLRSAWADADVERALLLVRGGQDGGSPYVRLLRPGDALWTRPMAVAPALVVVGDGAGAAWRATWVDASGAERGAVEGVGAARVRLSVPAAGGLPTEGALPMRLRIQLGQGAASMRWTVASE